MTADDVRRQVERQLGDRELDLGDDELRGHCGQCGHWGRLSELGTLVPHPCTHLDGQAGRARPADTITAAGGFCAPLDSPYLLAGELPRPVSDFLPPRITAPRGGISYARPPAAGWGPPAPTPLKVRLTRRINRRRQRLAIRLHDLARWIGDEPEPEDWS